MGLAGALHLVFNSSIIEGPEADNSIRIHHFHHTVKSERNPVSGKIVGKRHGLFVFRKSVDQTTPVFHEMLQKKGSAAVGDRIAISLRQLAPYSSTVQHGGEQLYMQIVFAEVKVVSIETVMPDYAIQTNRTIHEYEDIGVAYKKVEWRGLIEGWKKTVEIGDAGGQFWVDWAWQHARVWAAKQIASAMKGKDDEEDDKKKDKKDDDKKP